MKKEKVLLTSSYVAMSDTSFPHIMWIFSLFSHNIVTADTGSELPKDRNQQLAKLEEVICRKIDCPQQKKKGRRESKPST